MDKKRNKILMEYAEQVLNDGSCSLFKSPNQDNEKVIMESCNGQVSALGVSILMIGLKPTIAVYYQDESRRNLLEVVAKMLAKYKKVNKNEEMSWAESLTRYVMKDSDDALKRDILDCSVALKQVIRTYKMG